MQANIVDFTLSQYSSCPGSTDSDLLLILSHGILFSLIFGLSCLTAVEKQSVQARALEPMKIKGFFAKRHSPMRETDW